MHVFLTPHHVGRSDAGTQHDYEKMSCRDVWEGRAVSLKQCPLSENFPQGTAGPCSRFRCDMGLTLAQNGLWV